MKTWVCRRWAHLARSKGMVKRCTPAAQRTKLCSYSPLWKVQSRSSSIAYWNSLLERGKPGLLCLFSLGIKGNKSLASRKTKRCFYKLKADLRQDSLILFPLLLTATPSAGSALSLQGNNPTCLIGGGRLAFRYARSLVLSILDDFLKNSSLLLHEK